ncbi:ZN362 protein [Vespula squamosa]|uniref:ZN362 protein n=1 Tax=Vespula squamosa TaxID=30214 RepID=A0ABD1ZZ43_VESSQ
MKLQLLSSSREVIAYATVVDGSPALPIVHVLCTWSIRTFGLDAVRSIAGKPRLAKINGVGKRDVGGSRTRAKLCERVSLQVVIRSSRPIDERLARGNAAGEFPEARHAVLGVAYHPSWKRDGTSCGQRQDSKYDGVRIRLGCVRNVRVLTLLSRRRPKHVKPHRLLEIVIGRRGRIRIPSKSTESFSYQFLFRHLHFLR